jgi:hypothetical protein
MEQIESAAGGTSKYGARRTWWVARAPIVLVVPGALLRRRDKES